LNIFQQAILYALNKRQSPAPNHGTHMYLGSVPSKDAVKRLKKAKAAKAARKIHRRHK
jgi:hypothetical protein